MTEIQKTVLDKIKRMIEVSGLPSLFATEIASSAKITHGLSHTQTYKAINQLYESGDIVKITHDSKYKPDSYKPSK